MADISDNWIAPETAVVPDFIICGAMKSGTSTLHYILNQHPRVFIPDGEIHFFDIDHIFQHPDFNFYDGSAWLSQDITGHYEAFWEWYSARFRGQQPGQLTGEDSTTYLASEVALKRIAMQRKEIRIIIMLRHPSKRAYSQYWHMLGTGRLAYNFEDSIRFHPHLILERSMYEPQLRALYRHIPEERVKVVLFEEFLADKEEVLREICHHIGIDAGELPAGALDAHINVSRVPKYPELQLFRNWLLRGSGNRSYTSRLPLGPPAPQQKARRFARVVHRLHQRVNPLTRSKPPEMKKPTREFLDRYFKRELAGMNELLGRDVLSVWFGDDQAGITPAR